MRGAMVRIMEGDESGYGEVWINPAEVLSMWQDDNRVRFLLKGACEVFSVYGVTIEDVLLKVKEAYTVVLPGAET